MLQDLAGFFEGIQGEYIFLQHFERFLQGPFKKKLFFNQNIP